MHATPVANSSGGNQNSNGQSSGITANDFLTLLVTEMKNQDPTAQTDPNEYINQLVQVNSLQQLIEINQNLSSALGSSNNGSASSASGKPASAAHAPGTVRGVPDLSGSATGIGGSHAIAVEKHPLPSTSGNLGTTVPAPAAQRVAHALSSHK
jgi:flagellar basal-body rod modification protein FlgD